MDVWKLRGKVPHEVFEEWEEVAKGYVAHLGLLPPVLRGEHPMTPEEWKATRDALGQRRRAAYMALVEAGKVAR